MANANPRPGMVFYGMCTYWTDNFSNLSTTPHGIPCCPHCGAVGFEIEVEEWFRSAEVYESKGKPGYVEFVKANKEVCHGRKPFSQVWQEYEETQGAGKEGG